MAHHLTLEEREVIARMQSAGRNQAETARCLRRAESTISREFQRNRSPNGYWAVAAHGKAQTRRSQRLRVGKLQRPELRRYVQKRLRRRWSPDQIAALIKRTREGGAEIVSLLKAGSAYYAPGLLNTQVVFGKLEDCVRSAIAGRVTRDDSLWNS